MNALKTLKPPAIACLLVLPLMGCQTTTPPSSSVMSQTVSQAVEIERITVCEATKPGTISRASFDASPPDVREKMAGDVAAWRKVCGG